MGAHKLQDLRTLDDFQRFLRRAGRDEFLQLVATPVLVLRSQPDEDEEDRFQTSVTDNVGAILAGTDEIDTGAVFPIAKRPGGAFPEQIGVGRAPNTDVCLPFPKISKYHAFFTPDEQGHVYWLTDARSSNGTWVGEERLAPRQAHAVHDRDQVFFGPQGFVFYMPEGFCRMVEAMT